MGLYLPPPPPLHLDQTEASRAEKRFLESGPPLSQGLGDRSLSSPLISRFGSVTELVWACMWGLIIGSSRYSLGPGGVHISSDGDDRRKFLGLKFLIPGYLDLSTWRLLFSIHQSTLLRCVTSVFRISWYCYIRVCFHSFPCLYEEYVFTPVLFLWSS